MTGKRRETLDAITRALVLEKETLDFYTVAEKKACHPEGRRLFKWLALTEEEHCLRLTELYTALNKGGRLVFSGGSALPLEPAPGDVAAFQADDREALELAIGIERKSIDYFDELASLTTDPDGRRILETLRDEEKAQLRVIEEKCRQLAG